MPSFHDRMQNIAEHFGAAIQDHNEELQEALARLEKQIKEQENEESAYNFRDVYLKSKQG